MAVLANTIIRVLNHLVAGEPWAAERLRTFAGQHLLIEAGPLRIPLALAGDGQFTESLDGSTPDVTITLPADFPALLLVDRSKVFASAKLAGSADFAEALAFVFRNLRWDVEADIAALVGDIAARRLVQAGRHLHAWQSDALSRAGANLSEYLSEESELIVPARELSRFTQEVSALRDDLARLEKRLQRLG